MKASKTQKHLKEMPYPPKKLLKKKENNIKSANTNAPISKTFSEFLKLTIHTYRRCSTYSEDTFLPSSFCIEYFVLKKLSYLPLWFSQEAN